MQSDLTALDVGAAKDRFRALDRPPRVDLMSHLRRAGVSGVTPARLARGLLAALHGPGRLTIHEYFYYRLDDPALSRAEIRRFVGKRGQTVFHLACNDPRWFAIADDKALFYTVADGAALPVPSTHAAYAPGGRTFPYRALRTPAELGAALRDQSLYPLFLKPIDGTYSIGALSLSAINGEEVQFTSGDAAPLAAVVQFVADFGGAGFLLQERLAPHPVLRQAFGDTLPSVRFLVLLSSEGTRIESAVLKIPARRNPADNYWRPGNMLGALYETGLVRRVVSGTGMTLREVELHPDTEVPLRGLAVPGWDAAVALCRTGAGLFPGIRTQSWDVAITERGPMALEFNFGGDLNLHQLAHGRGALTPGYVEHLKECGYRRRL